QPGIDHGARVRILFRTKRVSRPWQKNWLDVGFCQRVDSIGSSLLEMICRRGSQFRRQACATAVSQLIDVHPQFQSVLFRCGQNATGLVDIEVVSLAKDVAVFCHLLSCNSWQHLSNDERNIAAVILPKFRWKRMRAQKCRNRLQRCFLSDALDYPQNFQFVFKRESVAGLCFHHCRSILQKPARALFRECKKFVLAGCARCLHSGLNPAPALCNLFVSLTPGPCFVIVEAATSENQMRMRVNESWQYHASTRVDDLRLSVAKFLNLGRFADMCDLAAGRHKSPAGNNC